MSGSYHIEHTIRHANSWQPFSDVTNQAGVIGAVELACAGINDELHVCAIANAHLYHTIRHANSWQAFGDVEAQANDIGNISDVACAAVNGELNVCAIAGGHLYHTIRHANSWQAFGDVETQANDIGNISDVACAAVNGELHVCAIIQIQNGWSYCTWHTIRHANSWQAFGNVTKEASYDEKYSGRHVACANVKNELHVCVIDEIITT